MNLRHGFKSEADFYALEMRDELQLQKHEPLCPWRLASHLEIPLIPLSKIRSLEPRAIDFLRTRGREYFSAVTFFPGIHGRRRVICHNDGHAVTRQAADLSHELSHAILGHPPTKPFEPDEEAEEEAKWMGPALLVSRDAAMHIALEGLAVEVAAKIYGVSEQLMQMRINVTGVLKQVQRIRSRRRRS